MHYHTQTVRHKALNSLNIHKSMGGDGIPPVILKGASTAIVKPLHHLFDICIKRSKIPSEWRDHFICPIPKAGDKTSVSNYRPISYDLSWSKHYEAISKKAYNQLYLIKRRFSNGCPSSVKRMLYIALVRSQLTYCSPVWRPMFLHDIIRLEKIQRRATKFIVNDSSLSYRERLISLNLMPLMYFYEYIDLPS